VILALKERLQRLQCQSEAGKVRQRSLIHRLDQICSALCGSADPGSPQR
jgi:hypothetical protein